MSSSASPINIPTSRTSSASPRVRESNLTSQIHHQPTIDIQAASRAPSPLFAAPDTYKQTPQESVNMLGTTPLGARSIPFREGQRRGSNTNGLSGSLVQGMSWGGISVGSFIRDDVLMTGTSPYGYPSPSFHSSSYLPKMEATYMKDYVCCDIHLDSMHELLQHYEEAHATQSTYAAARPLRDPHSPNGRSNNFTGAPPADPILASTRSATVPPSMNPPPSHHAFVAPHASNGYVDPSHDHIGTFDNLEDMEMDDGAMDVHRPQRFQPQPQFGRQQPRGSSVNVNLANAFQGHGLNSTGPTATHANQQSLQNNITVSAVNTPTLGAQTSMSRQASTPDSSMPGTPAEFDTEYGAQLNHLHLDPNGHGELPSLPTGKMCTSGTIDDPAKRLLSRPGHGGKGVANPALANCSSELGKRVKEQQLLNGRTGAGGFVHEEVKPFRCPVIGCEKAYKNQNGLKYHKQHGHQSQQLKENADGTFSIVDPATSIPYPGTIGMEKEKPYRCEVCGKRYKNLNGLKYHRQHSPHCNPDFALHRVAPSVGASGHALPLSVNVAGAGLGMDMTGF